MPVEKEKRYEGNLGDSLAMAHLENAPQFVAKLLKTRPKKCLANWA